jgi:hypothetical protein
VSLLKEVDVNSLRSISQLDSPDKLVGLQEAIRESVSEPGLSSHLSSPDRKA